MSGFSNRDNNSLNMSSTAHVMVASFSLLNSDAFSLLKYRVVCILTSAKKTEPDVLLHIPQSAHNFKGVVHAWFTGGISSAN